MSLSALCIMAMQNLIVLCKVWVPPSLVVLAIYACAKMLVKHFEHLLHFASHLVIVPATVYQT